jgi:hypothetical protein
MAHGADGAYGSKGTFQDFIVAVWKAACGDESELKPRTLRKELRALEVPLKEILGKPIQGLAR